MFARAESFGQSVDLVRTRVLRAVHFWCLHSVRDGAYILLIDCVQTQRRRKIGWAHVTWTIHASWGMYVSRAGLSE